MKKILLIIAIAISTNIYAQKGSSQFSLFGGFEHLYFLRHQSQTDFQLISIR